MNRPWKSEDSSSWAVHFAGGQEIKWALDEDLRWVRRALDGHVRPTSPWRSQIVHAAWWPSAWLLGTEVLADQKVICFSDNAPSFYARQPEFHAVRPFVDKWIARSREAVREFLSFGIQAEFAPYCVDPKVFFPLPAGDADVQALRRQLGLPKNSYVIGNFHSDTAFTLGPDRPKWQKGPDIFAEIVRQVREVEPAVCVLLAGPRRHWLRQRLQDCGVPVFFVGRAAEGDDFGVNILDRSDLNRLYNLLDLCLITSRWEGGPHSILEACFAKTKLLSTRVGISEDVLEGVSLFNTIPEAVSGVVHDIRERSLAATCEAQYRKVLRGNTPGKFSEEMHRLYQSLPQKPPKGISQAGRGLLRAQIRNRFRRRADGPKVIGLLRGKTPGKLFTFLQETLRQSDGVTLRSAISADCRSYLVDESWFSSRDWTWSSRGTFALVSDDPDSENSLPVQAIIVPRFELVRSKPGAGPLWLVIPPALEGERFGAEVPVPAQLTSTPEGVVQSIRQLFLVLTAPEDVRWLGFR